MTYEFSLSEGWMSLATSGVPTDELSAGIPSPFEFALQPGRSRNPSRLQSGPWLPNQKGGREGLP